MLHTHRPKKVKAASHHSHDHHHHRPQERRRLMWCIGLTGLMMLAEFVGGFFTHSLALISDAEHMLSHLFALTVSYFAIWFASRPETSKKTFGYYRIEILAAFCNGLSLIVITGFIVYFAVIRLLDPVIVNDREMLIVAIVGLAVNLVTAKILHQVSHDDLNVHSAFLHMLGDTLSSVGVIGAAVAIHYTQIQIIDPIASLFIAVVILIWSFKLLYASFHVLMESVPRHLDSDVIGKNLRKNFHEIEEVHDIHIWEITSKMYALTAHVVIKDRMLSSASVLLENWKNFLDENFDIEHATIQIETPEK
jgi:cobalt-zinc-cadmium efflux system protein